MSTTTELRWFYQGMLPCAVADWFYQDALGQYSGQWDAREDCYLIIPVCDYLNVKWRDSKLELKLRSADHGVYQFGDRWIGQVEQWVKWTCSESTAEAYIPQSNADERWLTVKKRRSQRRYQISSDDHPMAVPLDWTGTDACSVEITQLQVVDQDWWSLALETVGCLAHQPNVLRAVASWLSQTSFSPSLMQQQSCAYPAWLNIIARSR